MITAHILFIYENPTIPVEILCEFLEDEEDMHVTVLRTIPEDVAEIEKLQPDLVLMALTADGTQEHVWACRQHLKSHQATKDIPVVLYSHHAVEIFEYLTQGQGPILAQPGIEFISAPFDLDEVLSRLRQLLPPKTQ